MKILILNEREVEELLPMQKCIDLMAEALTSLARGEVILPLRPVLRVPDTPNAFALMPAYSKSLRAIRQDSALEPQRGSRTRSRSKHRARGCGIHCRARGRNRGPKRGRRLHRHGIARACAAGRVASLWRARQRGRCVGPDVARARH